MSRLFIVRIEIENLDGESLQEKMKMYTDVKKAFAFLRSETKRFDDIRREYLYPQRINCYSTLTVYELKDSEYQRSSNACIYSFSENRKGERINQCNEEKEFFQNLLTECQ